MEDAVVLAAGPLEPLRALRHRVTAATRRAGVDPLLEVDQEFWPHVTLGYLHAGTDSGAVSEVVRSAPQGTAEVTCDRLTQALVSRVDGHYRWRARAELDLSSATRRRRLPVR
jgi:2'-5' RNA ligase